MCHGLRIGLIEMLADLRVQKNWALMGLVVQEAFHEVVDHTALGVALDQGAALVRAWAFHRVAGDRTCRHSSLEAAQGLDQVGARCSCCAAADHLAVVAAVQVGHRALASLPEVASGDSCLVDALALDRVHVVPVLADH